MQQGCEQAVQFVAKAAAPPADNLVIEQPFVEHDGPAEMNVQVLERHHFEMSPVERAQGPDVGRAATAIGDAT